MSTKEPQKQAIIRHAASDMANILPEPAAPAVAATPAATTPTHKIGEGHLMGMLRLGAHELTQILPAFPDSNVKPMEEPGVFGNPTQQIVTQEMQKTEPTVSDPASRAKFQNRDVDRGIER